jgi:hypothetical protein
LGGALLLLPRTAHASLGSDASSVRVDVERLRAADRLVEASDHTVHEMRLPGGTVVREYVSRSGVVFGVTWKGPFRPDLSQLMGAYFQPFTTAVEASRRTRLGRGPLDVRVPGLITQMSGHARSFHGRAYLPGLVPQGFSVDEMV